MELFHNPRIDFMSKRKFFFYLSTTLNVLGIILTIIIGIEYGIDFQGGSELAVKFSQAVQTNEIRSVMENVGFKGAEIKSYGKENQFLIRIKESEHATDKVQAELKAKFPNNDITLLKSDKIGPKIGQELRSQAFLAVFLSVIAIMLYIAFRFEFLFGLGAIIALVHDVIITFTFIVAFNATGLIDLEVNQQILAAMLTVIGFSVNDTVIIFDRIRENKDKHKGISFLKLCNISINETLSRTVITVWTVVLVLATLVAFGGPVLQGFAFTMLIGIITGTYSSIYIASAFVVFYLEKVKKVDFNEAADKKAAFSAANI